MHRIALHHGHRLLTLGFEASFGSDQHVQELVDKLRRRQLCEAARMSVVNRPTRLT